MVQLVAFHFTVAQKPDAFSRNPTLNSGPSWASNIWYNLLLQGWTVVGS